MLRYIKLFFTVSSLALIVHVNSQSQDVCSTGTCVPILSCETVTLLLQTSPKPLPPSVAEKVKSLHCGSFSDGPHVCCEQNNVTTTAPTIRKSTSLTDLDVQSGMAILGKAKCGKNNPSDGLIIGNGDNAELGEYPWMALLVYTKGSERTLDCGGSLITDRYVLTAAHCIQVRNAKLISVRLGEHDLSKPLDCLTSFSNNGCLPPVQEIDIETAVYHKDFSKSKFLNDIGLIRLSSKAIFNDNVRPICLPITAELQTAIPEHIIIAGWGRVENGERANILQKAEILIKDNDYCQQIHKLIRINDQQICAGGEKNIDTCKGDSGGPIFQFQSFDDDFKFVQYGVVSAGGSQCGGTFPGIYVKVASYLQWIAGHIKA